MGITIHFRGKINSPVIIDSLIDDVKSFADELGWKYNIFNYDFSKPHALKGIILSPHPKSESLDLLFDKYGDLNNPVSIQFEKENIRAKKWNSIKIQFAPIHIHIAVVKLLQFIKSKYVSNLKVADEGEYWNTGNLEGLDERRETLNRAMDILAEGLKTINISPDVRKKETDIVNIIEKIAHEEVFQKLKKRKKN